MTYVPPSPSRLGIEPATAETPEQAPRERPTVNEYTCGLCGLEFTSNCDPADIVCECDAQLCPCCGAWFNYHGQVAKAAAAQPAPELAARLEAAEKVCVMFSWTAARMDGDRDKALHELWRHWAQVSGVSLDPEDHPGLSNDVIAGLARQRDETRARVLAAMEDREDTSEPELW